MFEVLTRYKKVIFLALFLSFPVFLLYFRHQQEPNNGIMSGLILDAGSLIERGLLGATGYFAQKWDRYRFAAGNYEEFLRLKGDSAKADALKSLMKEIQLENQRLQNLVKMTDSIDGSRPIGARVIGRIGAPLSRVIHIDRGSIDGIAAGDAVLSATGAVGQVRSVARYSSEVLLLTDTNSAIDVVIQRSRARGLARGASLGRKYRLMVEDFDRLQDIQVDDVIVTSGLGGQFPLGVPVGKVTKVKYPVNDVYVTAEIVPVTDFSRLEEVLILPQSQKPYSWRSAEIVFEHLDQSVGR